MLIVLPLALIALSYYFNKGIRLNSIILYIIAIVLSALTFLLYNQSFFEVIENGQLGFSFIFIVMLTGALPKGSKIKRKLRNVRKEYAILAFLFITPHTLLNIYSIFIGTGYLEPIGLITYLIMIPLVLSSLNFIKKDIRTSRWIKIHKFAYLVYFLVYAHLMIVSNYLFMLFYSILFGTYLFLKLYYYYFRKRRLLYSTVTTLVIISAFTLLTFNEIEYNYEYTNILENNEFEDGTYYGESDGYRNFKTKLYVTVVDNKIVNITLEDCGCTPNAETGFYLDSAYNISNDIAYSNRTDVDSIAGATATSISINEAVIDALTKAKK